MIDLNNVLDFLSVLLTNCVKSGDTVIDGTAGNGYDTVTLSNFVGEKGIVYSFDIQEIAIEKSKKRLSENSPYNNVIFFNESHENIKHTIGKDVKINCAVFNLGFLPGGDKSITTHYHSSISAIENVVEMLDENGIVYIVVYWGHENGKLEKSALDTYIQVLDQKIYNCGRIEFVNQKNCPPILLFIQKRVEKKQIKNSKEKN